MPWSHWGMYRKNSTSETQYLTTDGEANGLEKYKQTNLTFAP